MTRHVLIVEDDDDIRDSLRDLLEDEGYLVDTAADGAEAVNRLSSTRPCLVLLDLMLPVISGNEVYERMQRDPALSGIHVIVSTSDPSRAPQGVPLMRKPIQLDLLLETLADLCP